MKYINFLFINKQSQGLYRCTEKSTKILHLYIRKQKNDILSIHKQIKNTNLLTKKKERKEKHIQSAAVVSLVTAEEWFLGGRRVLSAGRNIGKSGGPAADAKRASSFEGVRSGSVGENGGRLRKDEIN